MAYSSTGNSDLDYSWDQIDDSLSRTRDKTGLDTYAFDKVKIDHSMPSDTLASTHYRRGILGDSTTLKVNSNFPYLSDHDQDLIVTHEAIHANMYNDRLNSQLHELGLSRDSRRFINSNFNQGLDTLEGATQLLTETIYPNTEKSSLNIYPSRTRRVRRKADQRGLNLGRELEDSHRTPSRSWRRKSRRLQGQRGQTSFDEIGDYLSGLTSWFTGSAS